MDRVEAVMFLAGTSPEDARRRNLLFGDALSAVEYLDRIGLPDGEVYGVPVTVDLDKIEKVFN